MDYAKHVEPFESQMSDAEIAAFHNAAGVTVHPINRADLLHLLNIRGMLRKLVSNNANEKWSGTVLAMQDAIILTGDQASIDAIALWFSHVTNVTNNIWDTTDPQFATAFTAMRNTFAGMPGMPTAQDFDAVLALGGGLEFSEPVTEQDVADCRADHLADRDEDNRKRSIASLQAELENGVFLPREADGVSTEAETVAAAIAYLQAR